MVDGGRRREKRNAEERKGRGERRMKVKGEAGEDDARRKRE